MSLVDVSIVNVALPSIQQGLGASNSDLQWVLSAFALTFGVGLVTAGRAGDLFGRGGLFIIGVALFTGVSMWAGLAGSPLELNIARALQGLAAGLISPQVIGIVQDYFRGAERGRAFGIFGAVVGVSVATGPVLGGLIIALAGKDAGWRWIFFVNIPVGIVAIVLAAIWLPKPLLRRAKSSDPDVPQQSRDLDPIGAVLLGLAVLAILFPFVESGGSGLWWLTLPAGIVILLGWLSWEKRYRDRGKSPMVDLQIFRVSSFANGTLIMGLWFLGMTSIWVLINLYFQQGIGHSALASGLVGLPSAVCNGLAALVAGRLVARFGRKLVIAAIYTGIAGLALTVLVVWLQWLGLVSEWWMLATLIIVGVSQGSVVSPNQALTLADVPLSYAGSSGGVVQTVQRIATAVGIAVVTAIAFAVLQVSDWSVAFIVGFAVIAVIMGITLIPAYADLRRRGDKVGL